MLIATASIIFYLTAALYQALQLSKKVGQNPAVMIILSALAISLHGYASLQWMLTDQGITFNLISIITIIIFSVNCIALASSFKRQCRGCVLLLFPLSALILSIAMTTISMKANTSLLNSPVVSTQVGFHIFLSILSFSMLTIAAFQALFLALQEWRLGVRDLEIFHKFFHHFKLWSLSYLKRYGLVLVCLHCRLLQVCFFLKTFLHNILLIKLSFRFSHGYFLPFYFGDDISVVGEEKQRYVGH
jgi:ABC-type uncharacterized transport system permease subunit